MIVGMSLRNDTAAARGQSRLTAALTLSLAAHVGLIALLGSRPRYTVAQAPGAIEVRIVSVTAADIGRTEPAIEAIESVPVASSDAISPVTAAAAAGPFPRLHAQASQVEETHATNQRQVVDTPVAMIEEPPIATLQSSPPSGSIYYAESEVDVMPLALDPITPRYPSGSAATSDGGTVRLRLLIDATGVVRDVAVLQAQPTEVFDESARDAFSSIRFRPAEKDGQAVRCQISISIVYAGSGLPPTGR